MESGNASRCTQRTPCCGIAHLLRRSTVSAQSASRVRPEASTDHGRRIRNARPASAPRPAVRFLSQRPFQDPHLKPAPR